MIRFIVGKADVNVSEAVRGEVVSLLEKSSEKRRIVYLVPDQFEYETEKAVYKLLNEKGLLKRFYEIKITTFSALCRDILEECGEHRPFADDIVKSVIMHKTLSENRNALSALNRIAARAGFCGRMVKTVSALKTSGITAKDLELSLCALEKVDKSFSDKQPIIKKLRETNLLYEHYEALLDKYIDKLDVTAMAAGLAASAKTAAFDGACVFVDCFNDFTHSQLEFLKQMITIAESVTFGFTSQLNSDCDVFRTPNGHISRLKEFAEENGLTVELITEGIKSRFSESSPLIGISKHLFQNARNRAELGDTCELITARSVYEELDYAAAKIKQLTVDGGMRYNEIAVLCTDVGAYGKYVESAFAKYDIPVFLDTPEPILYQPLINLVNSVLNSLSEFSVDTVLSCVKTGFFAKPRTELDTDEEDDDELIEDYGEDYYEEFEENEQLTLFDAFKDESVRLPRSGTRKPDPKITLSDKDIDSFESYIYEWDLKTSHLKKPFELRDKRSEQDLTWQTAERVRKAVAVPLLELRRKLHKDGRTVNGAEITELLYDFLINEVGMRRAIFKRCKNEQNTALDADKVAHYQRLWNSLADILDKLHSELCDTNVTIDEYRDIFREICAATKLADPPRFIDCVLVGDIDRTRADNIKAAFIVGASYELFPTPAAEAGIFSQYEIELICDKIIHIDGDKTDISKYIETLSNLGNSSRREYALKSAKEQYHLSLYRAYRAMTLPTEYLCVSCPECDIEGGATARSDVFTDIITTFENSRIIDAEKERDDRFYCRTLKAAKMRYAMGLDGRYGDNTALRSVLEREDGEFVKALDEIREQRRDKAYDGSDGRFSGQHSINPKTARLLFPASVGTTALEKLNKCKFEFFCEYGLKITERNKRSFTSSKRGEAIHFVFQSILREYSGDMDAFFRLRRSELLSLSKKYLAVYRENETNNDSTEDKRTEYLFNNIANSAADVLITVQTELFARRYRPKFFELNIRDSGQHALIDNEKDITATLPEAEIFSGNEEQPAAPRSALSDENAPYLITAPLTLTLDDGTEITVQGIIDRVDMFKAGKNSDGKPVAYVRVVDYKTSAHSFDLHNAENGINIQMLLYLFALQSANENNPSLELRAGGVDYIPSKNRGALDEAASPYRLLAMSYHESGLFIKDEVTENDFESYKKTVFDRLDRDGFLEPKELETIKKSFEPNTQNTAESAYFSALRENVLKKVTENLDAVFGGRIDALPVNYCELEIQTDGKPASKAKKTCDYCIFKEICGNAGKNVIKVENVNGRKSAVEWENRYITREDDNGRA